MLLKKRLPICMSSGCGGRMVGQRFQKKIKRGVSGQEVGEEF